MSSSDPISDFWLNLNSRFGNFIKRLTCNHFSNLDVLVPCFLCLLLYTAAQLWLQKLFLVFFISNNFFINSILQLAHETLNSFVLN